LDKVYPFGTTMLPEIAAERTSFGKEELRLDLLLDEDLTLC